MERNEECTDRDSDESGKTAFGTQLRENV